MSFLEEEHYEKKKKEEGEISLAFSVLTTLKPIEDAAVNEIGEFFK